MLQPHPDLPDHTPVSQIDLPPRIRNVLALQKIVTVGELRELPDATLLSFYDLGRKSVAHLREKLGHPALEKEAA